MLDASLTRILTLQFLAGRFDPLEGQMYTELAFDEVDAPSSRALAADGAQQGMVRFSPRNQEFPVGSLQFFRVGFAAQRQQHAPAKPRSEHRLHRATLRDDRGPHG